MRRHYTSVISSLFGKFATCEFPKPFQNVINSGYVRLMGLDMRKFKKSSSYKSLKELFIRGHKKPPAINAVTTSVVSPCDGKIVALGEIHNSLAYQIKGMEYNIEELLGAENAKSIGLLDGGEYINFYLSPKDYHRYHMPFDVEVLSILHIPGKLYPVNLPLLKHKKNLYIENERVVLELLDRFNHKHFIVLVGALNVGKMVVTFEPAIKTNEKRKQRFYKRYKLPKKLSKGELFGWFEMGSTIVIVSQRGSIKWDVALNKKVTFANVIGELIENFKKESHV